MGGIAIVVGASSATSSRTCRTEQTKFARTGITLMALIVGLAVVGFVDDYLGVRRGRNLGLRKRGKTGGQVIVAVGFALLALECVNVSTAPVVHPHARPRPRRRACGSWWPCSVVYGTTNAVNLTDGLDGLAAGSSAIVFAAFMIIAFWQFRHPRHLPRARRRRARPRGRRRRDVRARAPGSCGGTRHPRRSSWATSARSRSAAAMAGLALLTNTILLLPILGGLYVVETLSVIAQVISFRVLPPAGPAHGADPPPLRGRRLARVHGHRALLAARRAPASRSGSASSTPTSSASRGCSTDARSLVVGLGDDGRVGRRRTRARPGTT